MMGQLTERSAAYIAGYVLKKMSGTSEHGYPNPQFARMSLRPGIGADAMDDVASAMMQWKLEEKGDVPVGLRHGSAVMPLGRYLRNRLRLRVGLPEGCPDHVIEALRQGLQPVFDYADANLPHPTMARFKKAYVREAFKELNEQENRNIAAKSSLKKRSL